MSSVVRGAIEELESALRRIELACRELDPEAIQAAVDLRGKLLERLRTRLAAGTPGERAAVRDAVLSSTREAEQAVRRAQQRIAEELQCLGEGARALRRYAVGAGASSALDRSG